MKKILKIIGVSLVVLGVVFLFFPAKFQKCHQTIPLTTTGCINTCFGFSTENACYGLVMVGGDGILETKIDFWTKGEPKFLCSKAGELINHANGTNRCCAGLKAVNKYCPENNCGCKFASSGGITKCTDCGNGICDRENLENHCNCPKDCKPLKDTCGNGKCEQVNGEDKTFCAEDCFIDGGRVYSRKYYDKFRKKCGKDRCCLSSIKNAESQNSPLFESNHNSEESIAMQKANCPDGSHPETQLCDNSYIWCVKDEQRVESKIDDSYKKERIYFTKGNIRHRS